MYRWRKMPLLTELGNYFLSGSTKMSRYGAILSFGDSVEAISGGSFECSTLTVKLTIARRFNAGMLAHVHESHRDG